MNRNSHEAIPPEWRVEADYQWSKKARRSVSHSDLELAVFTQ
jgi:hypothetical protein